MSIQPMNENPFSVIQGIDAGADLRKAIAGRIRAVMAMKLIGDAELAAQLGQNPQWFSRRKLGHVSFTAEDLLTIAQYLDVSINDLYGLSSNLPGPGTPKAHPGSQDGPFGELRAPRDSNPQPSDP